MLINNNVWNLVLLYLWRAIEKCFIWGSLFDFACHEDHANRLTFVSGIYDADSFTESVKCSTPCQCGAGSFVRKIAINGMIWSFHDTCRVLIIRSVSLKPCENAVACQWIRIRGVPSRYGIAVCFHATALALPHRLRYRSIFAVTSSISWLFPSG